MPRLNPDQVPRFACTVCSSCIRRTVEFQERQGRAACPSCREPVDATDLRPLPSLKVSNRSSCLEDYLLGRIEVQLFGARVQLTS